MWEVYTYTRIPAPVMFADVFANSIHCGRCVPDQAVDSNATTATYIGEEWARPYRCFLQHGSELGRQRAKVSALRHAQKLIITTPEYNVAAVDIRGVANEPTSTAAEAEAETGTDAGGSTASVDDSTADGEPSTRPYRAVIVVNLVGGVDSWQMLLPNDDECSDLYDEYKVGANVLAR